MKGGPSKSERAATGKLFPWLYRALWVGFFLFSRIYNRLEKKGRDPGSVKGPAVFVCNHASNLDPGYVGAAVPQKIHFLAKKELFLAPLVGFVLRHCNGIPIDREGVDRGALRMATEALRAGRQMLLFPEGRRSDDGQLGRGKPGAGMIASQGGARCVPVYIEGSGRAMPRGTGLIRPAKVRISFGEAFDLPERPDEMSKKDYYQLCADTMMSRIAALRDGASDAAPRAF